MVNVVLLLRPCNAISVNKFLRSFASTRENRSVLLPFNMRDVIGIEVVPSKILPDFLLSGRLF